ncbi:hypothetical protein CB1_002787001 [Camelus ferus]|nr:hypothetical protein CB1_002787001 [Camelus ferus]
MNLSHVLVFNQLSLVSILEYPILDSPSNRSIKIVMLEESQESSKVIIFPEQINCFSSWADGFVCVYSVTDCKSYQLMHPLFLNSHLIDLSLNIPMLLVANKNDLLWKYLLSSENIVEFPTDLGSRLSAREHVKYLPEAMLGSGTQA